MNNNIKNPIKDLKFIERIVRAHRVSRDFLEKEYKSMIETLKNVYSEYVKIDPKLDRPSYKELPSILYSKFMEMLNRAS